MAKTNPFSSPLFHLMQAPKTLPPRADERFYAAFGRFIASYAAAETSVHQLARKLSGLKDNKARILFGGMRIGDVTMRTRALLNVSRYGPSVKRDIEECLAQFDIIGTERDKMVHRYSSYENGEFVVTNISTAKSVLNFEEHIFTIPDLLSMHTDCLIICLRLAHIHSPHLKKNAKRAFVKMLHGPWQYKPPPPKTRTMPMRQRIAQALLNPPASSQAKP